MDTLLHLIKLLQGLGFVFILRTPEKYEETITSCIKEVRSAFLFLLIIVEFMSITTFV